MTIAPYLLGRKGPGAYIGGSGGGGGGTGLEEEPIITVTAGGDVSIKGKVKPGSFGKFVYPLATIASGRQYTFRLTPHFSQLAMQGKLAMTGFGLKTSNDFHIVGLRGDGSTGLKRYQVYGTSPNGWNKDTGHTTADGGTPTNGTQAGPNWLRLITSSDGTTYTLQTSGDGGSSWSTELTAQTPTPFSNVSSVTTFGIALWFNNLDAGPFSIDIDQFADAVAIDDFIGALIFPSADVTATNFSAGTTMMTGGSEAFDTNAFHDTGVNPTRITIPAGMNGRYGIITCAVTFSVLDASPLWYAISVRKNGSANPASIIYGTLQGIVLGRTTYISVSTPPILLATNDYFECQPQIQDTSVTLVAASSSMALHVVG